MHRLAASTGLASLVVLALAVALGAGASRTVGAITTLSAADLALFHIHNAVDVTNVAGSDLPSSAVSREKAIALAQSEMGSADPVVEILHASAPRFMDEPDRTVWVVVFDGGVVPFDGPKGNHQTAGSLARVTGVIIDDTTGEFLSGFML